MCSKNTVCHIENICLWPKAKIKPSTTRTKKLSEHMAELTHPWEWKGDQSPLRSYICRCSSLNFYTLTKFLNSSSFFGLKKRLKYELFPSKDFGADVCWLTVTSDSLWFSENSALDVAPRKDATLHVHAAYLLIMWGRRRLWGGGRQQFHNERWFMQTGS